MSGTTAEEDTAPPATGASSASAVSGSVRTAKKIFIVKNGALYSRPQRVVIPLRLVGKWDAILQLLDESCSVAGGVHRVVNVEDWTAAKSFEDLEDAKLYVVLNKFEAIQKLDYQGMAKETSRSSSPRRKPAESKSQQSMKRAGPNVPSRWAEKDNHCRFRIYVNKSNIVRPFVVNVNMTEIQKFSGALQNKICSPLEIVFKRIEQNCSITLPENKPIRKMFTLEGVQVTEPSELTNDGAYVVAANEPFVDLNYEGRRLKNVIHHGPLGSKYKETKYLGNLPSADKSRYAQQSRKAAEQQRGRKTHRSDHSAENGHSTSRRDQHQSDNETPRNGTNGDFQNGYDTPRDEAREDSIPRFGDEGAPKLVETEHDRKASLNGDTKDDRYSDDPVDNGHMTPNRSTPNGRNEEPVAENGATTARRDSRGTDADDAQRDVVD